MTSEIWFEKYRPKHIEDLVLSNTKTEQIRKWFTDFKTGKTSEFAVMFIGPPGLGKTTLAHIILKEFGYHVKEFNASDIRSKLLIEEHLSGLINSPVNCFAVRRYGNAAPVNGIIMDEVDGMFKGDRGGVDALLTFISPSAKYGPDNPHSRKVPIICICNIGNVKKETINSLRKECFTLDFTPADNLSLNKVLDRIVSQESIVISEEAKNSVVEYAQGDFRRLINILEFVSLIHLSEPITESSLHEAFNLLCRKDQNLYITDAIRELINTRMNPHQIQAIYNGDKSKTPMVIYQNYLRSISVLKATALNKINIALVIVNSIIASDVIEKIMYNTQNWGLQTIQSYMCAHIPNYYMNIVGKTTYIDAKWASVLSINSQAQNLRKNIYLELQKMSSHKTYSIADLQQTIEIVFMHLINGDIMTAVSLLHTYNLFSIDSDSQSHASITAELAKKKALLVIDKLAKYIKISHYYNEWNAFKNKHKSDKELDAQIKAAIDTVTANNSSLKIAVKKQGLAMTMGRDPRKQLGAGASASASASASSGRCAEVGALKEVAVVKTIEEQKSLVMERKKVVIKKKTS